jgi:hypothetical protein
MPDGYRRACHLVPPGALDQNVQQQYGCRGKQDYLQGDKTGNNAEQ